MASRLEQTEIDFLGQIPGIQLNMVGPMLGAGGAQHVVREYGETDVAKYPWYGSVRNWWANCIARHMTPTYDEIREDYDICLRHFGKEGRQYPVVTDIRKHAQSSAYLLLQEKLHMEDFTPKAYEDRELREQIEDILRINAEVRHRYGKWLDVMGFTMDFPIKPPNLANTPVLTDVSGNRRIGIHDFSLFPAPSLSLKGIMGAVQLSVQRWQLMRFNQDWWM